MIDDFKNSNKPEDKLHVGLQILSFCIPLAGAIIYFMNKKEHPEKAKTACFAALIGIAVALVLQIVTVVLGGAAL